MWTDSDNWIGRLSNPSSEWISELNYNVRQYYIDINNVNINNEEQTTVYWTHSLLLMTENIV